MRRTIFDTPVIRPLLRGISYGCMKLLGWQLEGEVPPIPKFVMIAAPHTSNWDLPVMLFAAFLYRARIFWMGKHTLFWGPLGPFFRWLGGIPIDRSGPRDLVAQSVDQFRANDTLILAVPPEGTRSRVRYWKTGFYYIALGAGVPIVLGYIDYSRKAAGLGPALQPSGNLDEDMKTIRAFYDPIAGKYPDQFGQADVTSRP
jgi:1-acyl-sn-glycerol-3-phosphate acyltransferase